MKQLVIMSDIHGNLAALEAIVASLPQQADVIVAGDLCLDGPRPAEVLDLLADLGWTLILGNTDRDIVECPDDLKPHQAEVVRWTREQLGEARLRRLSSLPFSTRFAGEGDDAVLVVHANPLNLDEHLPPTMSEEELRPYLREVDAALLAFGHLHTPYVRPVNGIVLVDVSSVGHPKDRDLRAAYTVISWENERRSIEQVRVPYDVERTVGELRSCGMPHAEEQVASLLKASY